MSDQLFEVAFSGQVSEGANPEEVKARVGKMFNADQAKLVQLFSGKRIVIKKNVDQATANKYLTALNRAGAECEIVPMAGGGPAAAAAATPAAAEPAPAAEAAPQPAAAAVSQEYESSYDGDVAPPPQTDPLGITGDQIEDLAVSIAPVGSELQDDYQQAEEPDIDITGFDIAPVGSELSTAKQEPDPPPPDTSGITLAD
jgi:ribosomal protein L12E/L44/L45/RPP1/RPP2